MILHISADSHVQPTLSPYSYPVHMRLSVRNNPVNRVEFLWPISEKVLKTNEIVRLHCTSLTIVNLLSLLECSFHILSRFALNKSITRKVFVSVHQIFSDFFYTRRGRVFDLVHQFVFFCFCFHERGEVGEGVGALKRLSFFTPVNKCPAA